MFTIPAVSAGNGRTQVHINAFRITARMKTVAKCQEVWSLTVDAKELFNN
jgi:hypothetical protein